MAAAAEQGRAEIFGLTEVSAQPIFFPMKLIEWLGDRRGRRAEFARMIGISPAHMSEICAGIAKPSLDLALRIEEATGGEVTPRDLLRQEAAD